MVLESVSCTEEDLLFTDAETGTDADAETFALEQLSTVLLYLHKRCQKKTRAYTMQQTVKCGIAKNQQRFECFHSLQIVYKHEHREIM